jgi:YVTN family beta-propeller protein
MHSLRQSRPGAPKWQRSSAAAVGLGLLLLVTALLGSAAACGAGPTIPDRFIYVTNQLDNTLSVIDGSTYKVVATVPVGAFPAGVVVSPDGRHAYIAQGGDNAVAVFDTNTNDVSVIDTRTNRVVRVIPAGQFPAGVAVTHDGASVYVANELSANVTVINTRSGAVEATLPSGIGPFNVATSPTDNAAYVADLGPGNLVVIDTGTRRTSSTVTLGSFGTDPFTRQPLPTPSTSPTRARTRCP